LNYLAIFVEQFFSKTHLDASEKAKTFFFDVTKVENLDKKLVKGLSNKSSKIYLIKLGGQLPILSIWMPNQDELA
jgi:hypothetical protein